MITLRRDISSSINMGAMSDSLNLTDYDRYVLGRKDNTQDNFIVDNSTPNYFSSDIATYYKEKETQEKQDTYVKSNGFSCYDEYMDSVLHRTTKGEKVLTRAEFEARYNISNTQATVAHTTKSEAKGVPGTLTKAGKIFVSVYVLLVAVVAFVLIAINTFARETVASASDIDSRVAVVETMDEDGSSDWYNGGSAR